ncbi:MAG: hypothetical protein QOJ53_1906 [Sphingomonadales bacterium]|jgi:hypothetical protein|nr:hypothetical protein [Sphingomonadales bacterium]MEA3047574.1 hypothetical protein [Sphingomonadales bacterium]
MIISNALRSWLDDRPAQRRTQQAIDRFGRDWNRGPVQQRFDDAFAALPVQSAEAAADAAKILFADDVWLDALIAGLAGRLSADPFFDPPFRAMNSDIHSGLVVYEDPRVAIAVGVTDIARLAAKKSARRGATSVGFTGRVTVLKFVKADGARISLWEAPAITASFNAAQAGRCARTGERDLADGDILVIDGRHQTYLVEQARANLLVVQAEINLDQAPLSVEYDSATLAYVGCSANGDGASRIQMITTLLRKLGCAEAFEAVAGFIDHPDFFVRWHVMRELLGIDAQAALPHLRRMAARDPHPDARRAARSVLDRLDAPRPRKAA